MQPPNEQMDLAETEKRARLRLARTDRVGPVTFRQLISRYGSAEKALTALPELSRSGGARKPLTPIPVSEIETEIQAVRKAGAVQIFLGSPDYPVRLAALEDAPPVLTAFGHTDLLHRDALAIVGPRNASAAGAKLARILGSGLASAGLVIVSGMARGIDGAAHSAGLETGTIACLAGGADYIYPRENEALYWRLREAGCLVSEMPLGTKPQARHFPRRNRIISGLALGVLVVEAAERSGTLITARFAAEQGREVFAVPGSPLDPRAKGTNRLIRDGAVLVEGVEDILHELDALRRKPLGESDDLPLWQAAYEPPEPEPVNPQTLTDIRDSLSPTPVHLDDLVRTSGRSASEVQSAVLLLELAGEAVRYSGGRVARITMDETHQTE